TPSSSGKKNKSRVFVSRVLARYSICLLTRVLGYAFLGVLVSKKTEEELANLNIIDEEEVAFREETLVVEDDYKLCVVG
ncbi:hypothetical protein Gohar_008992, partial [Gossypium harknessii]|nr:hypothetical protein [Gossypium harknessii]